MNSPEVDLEPSFAAFATKHVGTKLSRNDSSSPPGLVIGLDGDLSTDNSLDFQRILVAALPEAKNAGSLIIDLLALKYISSTGVGVLTSVLVEAGKHRVPVYLCRMPERARSVLDLLGFTSFFNFIDGFEERH